MSCPSPLTPPSSLPTLTPSLRQLLLLIPILTIILSTLLLSALYRLTLILSRPPTPIAKGHAHILIVLGSGGHTAEMLSILAAYPGLREGWFERRTYVVSSGDGFSATKAREFEESLGSERAECDPGTVRRGYEMVTVRRARRVHQSFLTAPFTTLLSLYDCWSVFRASTSTPVDLILTNGPGTGVCVVFASLFRSFLGSSRRTPRTVYIESWARVTTLSLSGRVLRVFVNRFLVQWPQIQEREGAGVECFGPLVS